MHESHANFLTKNSTFRTLSSIAGLLVWPLTSSVGASANDGIAGLDVARTGGGNARDVDVVIGNDGGKSRENRVNVAAEAQDGTMRGINNRLLRYGNYCGPGPEKVRVYMAVCARAYSNVCVHVCVCACMCECFALWTCIFPVYT